MPRKKTDNPDELLSYNIIIRVTESLFNKLEKLRKESGVLSIADVCRKILLNQKIKLFTYDATMNPVMEELALIRKELTYRLAKNISIPAAIDKIGNIFGKHNPAYPYEYKFVNDEYEHKFNLEMLVGKLAGLFAGLAIFISCLGLFGLAAYVAEQRTKEIGIRKVLGASIVQVWLLISRDFIVLVAISCIIASPVALYYLHNWLQQYTYRVSIGVGVFIASGIAAIIITLFTISFQAVKAALANPVRSLRSE